MSKDKQDTNIAYILFDEIDEIKMLFDRAEIIMQDITEDYFGKYDTSSEKGRTAIVGDYQRFSIMGDIVSDYICQTRAKLDFIAEQTKHAVQEYAQRKEGGTV